ncbi:class I SAM-dependent methyltransferase [Aestuariibius sp. 2305UL40-4]|uniref:class I SAM-dependent methyltransferase n=1 Tax=Aestuariibius violaceus TaxID=3234132 RepID=UPI00345E6BB7
MRGPFYPPVDLPSDTYDLITGISVMTHLTEAAQQIWLQELRRVLRDDGLVLLSIHGAYATYNAARLGHVTPMVDVLESGLHDRTPDRNLGPKLDIPTYYKATYTSIDYIRSSWSGHFEVVDHFPSTNNLKQDFVLLRPRPA